MHLLVFEWKRWLANIATADNLALQKDLTRFIAGGGIYPGLRASHVSVQTRQRVQGELNLLATILRELWAPTSVPWNLQQSLIIVDHSEVHSEVHYLSRRELTASRHMVPDYRFLDSIRPGWSSQLRLEGAATSTHTYLVKPADLLIPEVNGWHAPLDPNIHILSDAYHKIEQFVAMIERQATESSQWVARTTGLSEDLRRVEADANYLLATPVAYDTSGLIVDSRLLIFEARRWLVTLFHAQSFVIQDTLLRSWAGGNIFPGLLPPPGASGPSEVRLLSRWQIEFQHVKFLEVMEPMRARGSASGLKWNLQECRNIVKALITFFWFAYKQTRAVEGCATNDETIAALNQIPDYGFFVPPNMALEHTIEEVTRYAEFLQTPALIEERPFSAPEYKASIEKLIQLAEHFRTEHVEILRNLSTTVNPLPDEVIMRRGTLEILASLHCKLHFGGRSHADAT
ncbi:hypothetical protein OIO90_001411 [Microbotryomycetes sp. JL221]|nr:hypothetical protein OIO90_001411 [Microbotryomycetes sp. JL221]